MKKIKSSPFSRGLALAKVSLSAGAKIASHQVSTLFASEERKTKHFNQMVSDQMSLVSEELGQLKGSLMKVGQLLSTYGEHFLPAEANQFLKSLQNQSPPLDWSEIVKSLQSELGAEKLAELEIEPTAIGAASLGQVHKARIRKTGELLALKVQYPGVDKAVNGDLKALKSILSMTQWLSPKDDKTQQKNRYDQLFQEVRLMLQQEVNYQQEQALTEEFHQLLQDDTRFVVPKTYPRYSTQRVLATSFEEGLSIDSPEILALSQSRRNQLAQSFLALYFKELFQFQAMQTDPHFGNYRIRLAQPKGQREECQDQIVLLDFGAVKKIPELYLRAYHKMIQGSYLRDEALLIEGAQGLHYLTPGDSAEQNDTFIHLCYLITEPFFIPGTPGVPPQLFNSQGHYRWGESDLPKRVALTGPALFKQFRTRTPPQESTFLDRKLAGVFVFLARLKAEIPSREILMEADQHFVRAHPRPTTPLVPKKAKN